MLIDKTATAVGGFRRSSAFHPTARDAFQAYLADVPFGDGDIVLLPAYIGWSPREGSGVFDPVTNLGLDAAFYPLTDRLHIDLDGFARALREHRVRVVVLIHYFGYVDPSYQAAVALARAAGALILEDEAHAMLTDMVGGGCGRLGDACIYSLHKLFPTSTGGMLVRNDGHAAPSAEGEDAFPFWSYDLRAIAERRRSHADLLTRLMAPLAPRIEPLWPSLQPFEVPQTYPVLVHSVSRFALYTAMNDSGFGVVSLYHTMIGRVSADEYPVSHWLADRILNLPVHQDADEDQLRAMVTTMARLLDELPSAES